MKEMKQIVLCAAIFFTAALILGQLFRHPIAVQDIVTGEFPKGYRLVYPHAYLFFAPFFHLADHITILSATQHISFLVSLGIAWLLCRIFILRGTPLEMKLFLKEFFKFLFSQIFLASFLAIVVLIPRPMARLEVEDKNLMILDFHSHTNYSWDARKSFSVEKNLQWHKRGGFQAAFITDHNVFDGSEKGSRLSLSGTTEGIISLKGEEVSLHKSHWVLLGISSVVPNEKYDNGPAGIELFLKDIQKLGDTAVIASLPEYWFYHWGSDMEKFAQWGVHGFEIANSVPFALDFTPDLRKKAVDFCRKNNLIMTGITDNHGWGSTVYVWNVIHLPGWREIPMEKLEQALVRHIKKERFTAVRVITRIKAEPKENKLWLVIDPLRQVWEGCRSMPISHSLICILWLWLPYIAVLYKSRSVTT